MGEKLFFSVIIENNTNSSITVSSIEVWVWNPVVNRHSVYQRELELLWLRFPILKLEHPYLQSSFKFHIIPHVHYRIPIFFVNLDILRWLSGILLFYRIRIVLHYMNVVSAFTLAEEYSFLSVKPFSLAFTRYQLNDTSYLINSIIINNLSKPMTITHIRIDNLISSLQETYNSFSEYCLLSLMK